MDYPEEGTLMDIKDHPDNFGGDHYASADVTPLRIPANDNKNLDLGTGGFDVDKAWSDIRKKLSPKPTLTPIPGGKS